MSDYTKGPWEIVTDDEKQGKWFFGLRGADGFWVATVETHIATPHKFNAHLMAAAPEMFETLKTIENDNNQVPDWLWTKIQAVIAKAEGAQ